MTTLSPTMFLGPIGNLLTVPQPQSGMKWSWNRKYSVSEKDSGGAQVTGPRDAYRSYKGMSFKGNTAGFSNLIALYQGFYGTGPFYMFDPNYSTGNLLPNRWASSYILRATAGAWCRASEQSSTTAPSGLAALFDNTSGQYPALGVQQTVLTTPQTAEYLSLYGSVTGGATVKVSQFNPSTNLWNSLPDYVPSQNPAPYQILPAGGTVTRTNLVTNPSFETASGTVNVLTNLCTNPSPATGAGWSTNYGTSGAGTMTFGAVTGFPSANAATVTWTTAPTTGWNVQASGPYAGVTAGQSVTASVSGEHSWAGASTRITLQFFDSTGTSLGYFSGPQATIAASTVTRLSYTMTAPANAVSVGVFWDGTAGTLPPLNATATVGAVFVGMSSVLDTYFDGSTPAAGDYTYAWSGTANASTSYQRAPGVAGWSSGGATPKQIRSTEQVFGRSYALKTYWPSAAFDTTAVRFQVAAATAPQGSTWTASADVYVPAGNPGVRIYLGDFSTDAQAPATTTTGTWVRVSVTFTVTNTSGLYLDFRPGTATSGGEVCYVDNVLLEESSTLGSYFDGSTAFASPYVYQWSGAADASTSQQVTTPATPGAVRLQLNVPSGATLTLENATLWDQNSAARTPGLGVGAVKFASVLDGTIDTRAYDRLGLSVDLVEVQS